MRPNSSGAHETGNHSQRKTVKLTLSDSNVGSQGGARREYPGDARDDVRIATLRKMVESRVDPPAFVTKPMGQWYD